MIETVPTPPTATTRPKVLIVDDELGPRESISYLLQEDFEVQTADRVDRGLELVARESFAVARDDLRRLLPLRRSCVARNAPNAA